MCENSKESWYTINLLVVVCFVLIRRVERTEEAKKQNDNILLYNISASMRLIKIKE